MLGPPNFPRPEFFLPFREAGEISGRAMVRGKILAANCGSSDPGIAPEKHSITHFSDKAESFIKKR